MNDIIDFLKNNSSWLKDISTIAFTATGTLVAVLSYQRAKSSIFQPKRTEVAKIQTQILTDFLTTFTTDGNSFDRSIDYLNIYKYNVDITLRDYNLADIGKITEKYTEYEQNIAGWFQFLENDIYNFILVEGSIKEYDQLIFEPNNRERQKFYERKAKEGVFEVHRIFYTKKYHQFHKNLRDLSNNPFLPSEIQEVANQIGNNMTINLHHKLKTLLTKLVEETYTAYNNTLPDDYEVISEKFTYQTLWRIFEKERNQHDKDYELLKIRIREHLRIDKE
jgi:flavodoxin